MAAFRSDRMEQLAQIIWPDGPDLSGRPKAAEA